MEACKQLGELGYHIFLSARDEERGKRALTKLREADIRSDFIQMDVTDEECIKKASIEFGKFELELDVLINNAAVLEDSGDVTKMPTDEIWNALNTNSIGVFIVIREFLPFIQKGGRIINVSSGAGAL